MLPACPWTRLVVVKVVIVGTDPPGRRFCDPGGGELNDVHVGVQIRRAPAGLVRGDASSPRWELDVLVITTSDGPLDFRGPAVQGRRGERFIYLTWGNVPQPGAFEMFRRAKLMLDRVGKPLILEAESSGRPLVGVVRLSDDCGAPRCARVDPPAVTWQV